MTVATESLPSRSLLDTECSHLLTVFLQTVVKSQLFLWQTLPYVTFTPLPQRGWRKGKEKPPSFLEAFSKLPSARVMMKPRSESWKRPRGRAEAWVTFCIAIKILTRPDLVPYKSHVIYFRACAWVHLCVCSHMHLWCSKNSFDCFHSGASLNSYTSLNTSFFGSGIKFLRIDIFNQFLTDLSLLLV